MSKRGENIYKRKDGRWEGRYIKGRSADGKAKYAYVYGRSYADTKQKLIDKRVIQNQSINHFTSRAKYGDILRNWVTMSRVHIKESTYSRYVHLANFVDTMEKHFTFNNDDKVYVRNTDSEDDDILLSSDLYTVTVEAVMKDGTAFVFDPSTGTGETIQVENVVATKLQITFANLKDISAINKDSKIIVRYSALLDTVSTTVGKKETDYNQDKGIYNKVYLEYSSDPNASGDSTNKTLEDLVRVYTYLLKVTKVDGTDNSKKLAGAAFKLKCVEGSNAGKWYLHDQSHGKIAGWTDNEEDASVRSTPKMAVRSLILAWMPVHTNCTR